MTSTSYLERMADQDLAQRGIYPVREFRCKECGHLSERGTKDRKLCFPCKLKEEIKRYGGPL